MTLLQRIDAMLAEADAELAARYPGTGGPQPVHTVYVPADRYDADTVSSYGQQALAVLDECADVLGAPDDLVERVRSRLTSRPIDDLRIDFEDGYGPRLDDEEDADVRRVASVVSTVAPSDPNEPTTGIRFKSLEAPTRARGLRTLELWIAEGGFGVVTLPKVTSVAQVEAMVVVCDTLGIPSFEIQIETPQSVSLAGDLIAAAEGRCSGLHFGTYDYTASLGIAAAYQSMEHPAADDAKAAMQVAAAGTGVFVSDGSTNILPVGPDRADAWRLHARLVRRSLERGFYQGWDLHPSQLPSRFLATFAFFRDGLTLSGHRLDEPATDAARAGFLLRAVECGAIDLDETGMTLDELYDAARRTAGPDGPH